MSAVDDAFHGLRHMISSGRLGAGQRFPPEADLCRELGVSRGPLREAVRMLSALGAVESRHGSGVYVSALRPEDIFGSLALTVGLLPLSGLLDVYELRRVLESHAAAQAAARASTELLDELDGVLDALEAEAKSLRGKPTLGTVTVGCALGYLDFRFPKLDWRAKRPKLAKWFATFSKLPSMKATVPPAS